MKRLRILIALTFLCALFLYVYTSAYADFDENSVIAVIKPRTGAALMSETAWNFGLLGVTDAEEIMPVTNSGGYGVSLFSASSQSEALCLTLDEGGRDKVLDAVDYLNSLDFVEWAQPNYIYKLDYTPNDTYYSNQYSMPLVNAPDVWDMNIDCSDTVIAVIDSGANLDHVDLKENIWTGKDGRMGYDFVNDDGDPDDNVGHGTHVVGILSAKTDNRLGVSSIAGNAKIAVFKAFESTGGSTSDICKALGYMKDYESEYGHTFSIINMSFGLEESGDSLLKSAIEQHSDKIVTAAAGNSSENMNTNVSARLYPACYNLDNIIAVANSDASDKIAPLSNYGDEYVDIAAPGQSILSTHGEVSHRTYVGYNNTAYNYLSGTSMATPLVASAAAALISRCPELTPQKAIEYVLLGADQVSTLYGYVAGGRRLNAVEPIRLALSPVIVTFNSDGGSDVEKQLLIYGHTATEPAEPQRDGYLFLGWTLDGEPYDFSSPVNENITLTASWLKGKSRVKWLMDDGSLIDTTIVTTGEIPYHENPTKNSDDEYFYEFTGWSPALTPAKNGDTYTAVFNAEKRSFLVTWKDEDGTFIDASYIEYGGLPEPNEPVKAADDEYEYIFKEWQPEITEVTGDAEYTAVYSKIRRGTDETVIPLTEDFVFTLTKLIDENGDAVVKKTNIADLPSEIPLTVCTAVYDSGGALKSVSLLPLGSAAVIPSVKESRYKIMIWSAGSKPVTAAIDESSGFFGN